MDPKLWTEIKRLVAEAAELAPEERSKLIDRLDPKTEVRAEVESLLAALDDRGSLFEQPLELTEDLDAESPSPGDQVGAYRLLDRLGGGGMGEVFLARQQSPIERDVAVKFIRTGLESEEVVRRFEAERQALALMGHRCIARIFEVGSHRGRPFLVMEKIDGEPIDRYCDRRELSIEQRLRLFRDVCQGVQHAHMKGVIHRDLKPSNVLVVEEDGQSVAKIIDFGIAKFVEQGAGESAVTLADQWLGTPNYMSPEQAAGAAAALDTRSDVFSLGVMLYELLCGSVPLEAKKVQRSEGLGEWLRALQDDDPPPLDSRLDGTEEAREAARRRGLEPASLAARLAGDLTAVVAKALARAPELRYGSPADLAADIERHLQDEPVFARVPTFSYVARKWIRRHRLAVAMATALLLSFAVGLIGTIGGLVRAQEAEIEAREEAERAQREASTSEAVKVFLVELFNGLNTDDPGVSPNLTLRALLDRGAARIQNELSDQPLVQAELMYAIGRSYSSLAVFGEAVALYREGIEICHRELGEKSALLSKTYNGLGATLNLMGRYDEAESAFRSSLSSLGDGDADDLSRSFALTNLAGVLKNQERLDEALLAVEQALHLKLKTLGRRHRDVVSTLTTYGLLLVEMEQAAKAVPVLEQALDIAVEQIEADHPTLAYPLNNLAMAHAQLGRIDLARPLFERAIAIDEKAYGEEHLNVAIGLYNLGFLTLEAGECESAKASFDRTLTILQGHFRADHPKVLEVSDHLAHIESGCPLS